MENKYYTPDIEDLKIGYECEFSPSSESNDNGKTWITHWKSITIDSSNLLYILGANVMFQVRTKYLTKKDIESEGWEVTTAVSPFFGEGIEFLKNKPEPKNSMDHFKIRHKLNLEQKNIRIEKQTFGGFTGNHESYEQVYYGKCYSINELKTIEKLLNIK